MLVFTEGNDAYLVYNSDYHVPTTNPLHKLRHVATGATVPPNAASPHARAAGGPGSGVPTHAWPPNHCCIAACAGGVLFAGCHAPGNIAVARNRHTFVYKLDSDWYDIVPSTLSTCMCRNLLLMAACGGTAACAAPGLRMARATHRDRRHAPPVQISCA